MIYNVFVYCCLISVEWLKEASKPVSDLPLYRIGAEGKVELKLVSAVSPGTIYIEHLPVLGNTFYGNLNSGQVLK